MGGEERHVEDRVDFEGVREVEPIGMGGNFFPDAKRTEPLMI
jgi:hypothetical protein